MRTETYDPTTDRYTVTEYDDVTGDGTVTVTDGDRNIVVEPAPITVLVPPGPSDPASDPEMLAQLAAFGAALRDPLADLTPSSASTTVRTAILNQRAALDALLAALETP